jgi:hypothetical protein
MGSYGKPWVAMGNHGQPWEAMGSHWQPWAVIGSFGYLLQSVAIGSYLQLCADKAIMGINWVLNKHANLRAAIGALGRNCRL